MHLFESPTYDFDWWMMIRRKRACSLTRGVHFLECPLIRDFTASAILTCLSCSQNSILFLIWWIVSETELQRSHTILHIRGQNYSLAKRSHIQFYYIYRIPNTCLVSQTIRKWGHENLGNLSSQFWQSSNVVPAIFKNF